MKNCDNINYDYYVPMGKPGSLVAKIPVILTYFEYSFPLYFKLHTKNYIDLNNNNPKNTRVIIDNIQLNKNKQLIIDGTFIKNIKYSDTPNSKSNIKSHIKSGIVKTPIKQTLNVNFLHEPNLPKDNGDIFKKHKMHGIKYTIDYIKVANSSYTVTNHTYINRIVLSIKLCLSQVQNVFIPEPEGNFSLLNKKSPLFKYTGSNCEDLYVVGYNQDKGLIADYASNISQ